MNIKAVIFDLDGTIVETERIIWGVWKDLGREKEIDVSEEMLINITGSSPEKEAILFKDHPEIKALASQVSQAFRKKIAKMKVEKANVSTRGYHDLMNYLISQQIPFGIGSNSDRPHVEELVSMLDYNQHFQIIVTRDDVANAKPHPEMFLKIADYFQVSPENVLVVEDSKYGTKAAKDAGMNRVLIQDMLPLDEETLSYTQFIRNSLDEVVDLIKTLNK